MVNSEQHIQSQAHTQQRATAQNQTGGSCALIDGGEQTVDGARAACSAPRIFVPLAHIMTPFNSFSIASAHAFRVRGYGMAARALGGDNSKPAIQNGRVGDAHASRVLFMRRAAFRVYIRRQHARFDG